MKQYAYRIYRNTPNNPIIGGTITAETMETALTKIIARDKIIVVHEFKNGFMYSEFTLNNTKVGILLYARPEDY